MNEWRWEIWMGFPGFPSPVPLKHHRNKEEEEERRGKRRMREEISVRQQCEWQRSCVDRNQVGEV